jgi:hypothetical protein
MSVVADIRTGKQLPILTGEAMTVMISKVPDWTPRADGMSCLADEVPALGAGTSSAPAGDWPAQFARMLTEALAGARPARQILPWTSRHAWSQFDRLLRGFRGSGTASAAGQPRIVRVLTSRPAQDVIEMSVIAGFGPRTRALALRLERAAGEHPDVPGDASGGWICTDIEAA